MRSCPDWWRRWILEVEKTTAGTGRKALRCQADDCSDGLSAVLFQHTSSRSLVENEVGSDQKAFQSSLRKKEKNRKK